MTINPELEFVGTMAVPEKDRLDEAALEQWLAANVTGYVGPITLTKFKGGQSNPTYRIDTPGTSYVLRRKPFGELLPSAHAVDREFKAIAALHPQGFPVAKPYGLCTDDSVIGSMFYIMGLADGRNLWDGGLPASSKAERGAIYNAMIDTLALLHSYDPVAIGLGDYGKPGDYCVRQIGRWSKQYRLSETETHADMDRLMEWLPRTIPPQLGNSVVHGDFRLDNMIFDADAPKVLAVLDWELSTLGDPIADFSYFLMNWIMEPEGRAGIAGLDIAALGIPTVEEATARYLSRSSLAEIPPIDWYLAFNLFRLAAILQGIKKRVIAGTASSAQASAMADRVPALARLGWEYAVKAGA